MNEKYYLIYEKYTILIKWIFQIIKNKDTLNDLEKEFLRKVDYFGVFYFDSAYVNLIPNSIIGHINSLNIKLILINLDPRKTGVCYGFFLRILSRYDKNLYSLNKKKDDKFEKDFQEIQILFDSDFKKFEKINFEDLEVGDVVIFEDMQERTHIGYIFDDNKSILSKLGDEYVSIEPLEHLEDKFGFPRFYKHKDKNFRIYFINNIIPLINRISLDGDLIKKILVEWGIDLNREINTRDISKYIKN